MDHSIDDINLDSSAKPLEDSVACIAWARNTGQGAKLTMFAASTWDGGIRVYNCELNHYGRPCIMEKFSVKLPVVALGLSWNGSNNGLVLGCSDGMLRGLDLSTSACTDLGQHAGPIRDVFYLPKENWIISASFDKTVKFWQMGNPNPVQCITLDQKIYAADFSAPIFAAALSEDKVLLLNANDVQKKVIIESPLGKNSNLQSIALSPKADILTMGCIDGRADFSKIEGSNL